jgi:Skp family chaperone for outer membrane proteins
MTERIAMKTGTIIAMALAAVAATGIFRQVQADATGAAKVAVVDVTRVLEQSKKHQAWKDKMEKEQEKMKAEFTAMRSELQSLEENIKLRNRGSEDYIKLTGQFVEKKAIMEAKNAFYEEKVTSQMQTWTEDLYKSLMIVVDRVAQQKGIDIVLAKEQLDLPAPSLRDFMLTIKTKKVLYNDPKMDITSEVLAALDSEK